MTITCVDFQQTIGNGREGSTACRIDVSHLEVDDVVVLFTTNYAGGGGEFFYNQTTGGTINIVLNPFGVSFSAGGPGFTSIGSAGQGGSLAYATIRAIDLTGSGDGDGVLKYIGWNNGTGNFYCTTMAMWTFRGGTISSGTENDDYADPDSSPSGTSTNLTAPALTAYQARFACMVGRSGWIGAGPAGVNQSTSLSPIGVSRLTTDGDPYSLWNAGYGADTSTQTHRVTWTVYGGSEELTSVDAAWTLPGYVYATHGPWYRTAFLSTITFTAPVTPLPDPVVVPTYQPRRVRPAELPYLVTSDMVKRK